MHDAHDTPKPTTQTPPPSIDDALNAEIADALAGVNLDELANEGREAKAGDRIHLSAGRRTRLGLIVAMRGNDVMVEFGPKSNGFCPLRQFDEPPEPGTQHEFLVERLDAEGLLVLSLPGAVQKVDWGNLGVGQTVEGRCVGVNKGGLEVEVAHHKGFMPAGQIDVRHVPDISIFLNEKITCRVTQLDRKRGNLTLSRRAVIEEERAGNREKILAELEVGQTRTVVVTSVQAFGAFADLGGVDGLIHVTELSHERVKDPGDVVKVGDEFAVKVLKIGTAGDQPKIALSRKSMLTDPRVDAMNELKEGETVTGTVNRIAPFGAFVEIAPGLDGLVHISEVSHERIPSVDKVLRQGEVIQAKILSIDLGKGQVKLSIKALIDRPASARSNDRGDRDAARPEDPEMRKLRARFSGDLKGGLS
jgi:ribosomal protein S1